MSFSQIPVFLRHGMDERPIRYEYEKLTLDFENQSDNPNPEYANDGDSGFDLRAWITENDNLSKLNKTENKYQITLKPMERRLIHTGLYFNLPLHTEIQVRSRSGISLREGLVVLNSPGTVDGNYTNEVGIIIINLSKKDITITSGDRIAQGVLMPVYCKELVNLHQVDKVKENNSRNKNGIGSTGIK
jgi:dUTP pyrophosphatase